MIAIKIFFIIFLVFTKELGASFCGENALPYSFEVLPSGNLILGCSRPNCLGWSNAKRSTFETVNGTADGFLTNSKKTSNRMANDIAECEDIYNSTKCVGDGEWIGGIAATNSSDDSQQQLQFRCCYHSTLKTAKFLSAVDITKNEMIEAGEVLENDKEIAFDYISNIVKFISDKGKLTYEVYFNRLPCGPSTKSPGKVPKKMVSNLVVKKDSVDSTKLFQAPLQIVTHGAEAIHDSSLIMNSVFTASDGIPPVGANSIPEVAEPPPPQIANIQNGGPISQPSSMFTNFYQPLSCVSSASASSSSQAADSSSPAASGASNYYYPVNPSCSHNFLCFSGDTKVQTKAGIQKRMDELEIFDWVLSSGAAITGWSQVNSWIHRMPKIKAKFIQFTLEDGKQLKITHKHFIYRGDCSFNDSSITISHATKDMVYAEDINASDCLFVNENFELFERRISKIETVEEIGIYAPMTDNGNIFVNDILASCFNIVNESRMQSSLSIIINEIYYWFFSAFLGSSGEENHSEIDLIPGLQAIVSIAEYILPIKGIY